MKLEGKRHRDTRQVKGLSPEITIVSEVDTVHKVADRVLTPRKWQGSKSPTGSDTVAIYQKDVGGTWENQYIPEKVCNHKPINGEDLQKIYWWSDKFIVAMRSLKGDGAKGALDDKLYAGIHLPDSEPG